MIPFPVSPLRSLVLLTGSNWNFKSVLGEDHEAWQPVIHLHEDLIVDIKQVFDRIERLTRIIANSRVDELSRLQDLLRIQDSRSTSDARLPCIILPPARNHRFYDRDAMIKRIDEMHERPIMEGNGPPSLALYGLGGVGKSFIALKFAHGKAQSLDAIFWIYSQTSTSIAQSFSDAAVRLGLADNREHFDKNRVLVLSWLQRTSKRYK